MKKIQYIAPMVKVFNVEPEGCLFTGSLPVIVSDDPAYPTSEDEVGIDNEGGIFGSM